ncbi:MAG: NUDIX domain-containing protein [Bacteroidia bacterium]|nr:NUDIX domain-containing protein [Bacteroidia bacterium]
MEHPDLMQYLATARIIPQLSIDCVIFGFHEGMLKVMLQKFRQLDYWALPGGFVLQTESLDSASKRILEDRTGLRDIYLEQFYVFGRTDRDTGSFQREIMAAQGMDLPPDHWIYERFVTVGYYALVDYQRVDPQPDVFTEACAWYEIDALPRVAFDHGEIIARARETLRQHLVHRLAAFNLMPETFTMNELQHLYEIVLGKKLLRANFQRKMLSLEILERVEKKYTGQAHKAPYLYRLNPDAQRNG